MIFTYIVSGLKGSVIYTDFQDAVRIEIKGEKISEVSDKLRQYFADNFLQANKIVLTEIKFS